MSEDIWDAIDPQCWRRVPHLSGRTATESDVKAGVAVFFSPIGPKYIANTVHEMDLPALAILHDDGAGKSVPVILIQAERGPNGVMVGYRPLSGGNGICLLKEVEILHDLDSRFTTA